MGLEFLLVVYPVEGCAVLADGNRVGFANHTLILPANEYQITLDGVQTTPPAQQVVLSGTSVVRPKVIRFEPA